MDATTLLNLTRSTYRSYSFYTDSGSIRQVIDDSDADILQFATRFGRPQKFEFEWSDTILTYKIWSDGKNAFERYPPETDRRRSSPGQVIAAAAGVSFGGAWNILSLLMPEIAGSLTTCSMCLRRS